MIVSTATDIGHFREDNQDRVAYKIINDNELFCVLCDGMGGHNAGEIAATLTVDYVLEHFEEHEEFETETDIKIWFHQLIHEANKVVYQKGEENEAYHGMGTTIVLAYVRDDQLYVSHVGDSRAYFYKDQHLEQLTVDDTLVNALLKNGYITKEQAIHHPQKNVLVQAIGVTDLLRVSFLHRKADFDDFMLCSDGLYNSLSAEAIGTILSEDLTADQKSGKLISEANIHGGYDNISVILLEGGKSHE